VRDSTARWKHQLALLIPEAVHSTTVTAVRDALDPDPQRTPSSVRI